MPLACTHRLPVFVCVALTTASGAIAQDSLRGFGTWRFDTEFFSAPITHLAAGGNATVAIRSDGRVGVCGQTMLPDPPPPPPSESYVEISIGVWPATHALARLTNGAIVTWGLDALPPAPAVPPGVTYTRVRSGSVHAVALRSDGVAVAWGDNTYGQTSLPPVPPGVTVIDAQAGATSSLLLLSNGAILACGQSPSTAVPVLPAGTTYTALWTGGGHAVARRSDGSFVAWGNNTYGQCNVPPLAAGLTYTQLAASLDFTIAVRSDGVLVGFGANHSGQTTTPTLPPGSSIAQVAAGSGHALARLANGTVVAWGAGEFTGPLENVPANEDWIAVASGTPVHGLTSSGTIRQLPAATLTIPPLPPGTTWVAIDGSGEHFVALRSDGRAFAWGDNQRGQCAIPPLPPGTTYTVVRATYGRTLLLRSDGHAVECGNWGQPTLPPQQPGVSYVDLDCRQLATLLLRTDGAITVVGAPTLQNVPSLPAGMHWRRVVLLVDSAAALRSDGEIAQWGSPPTMPALPGGAVPIAIDAAEGLLGVLRSDGSLALATVDPNVRQPLPPYAGEAVVGFHLEAYRGTLRVGPARSYLTYAPGCAGSLPAARLVPHDTPFVGGAFPLHVFELPAGLAVLAWGFARTAPVALAPLGMPGCFAHMTFDSSSPLVGTGTHASITVNVPNVAALVGASFTNQAIVFDAAANPAGLVVSNAAQGVIGRR